MKAKEIEVGGKYLAKVNGRIVPVEVIEATRDGLTGRPAFRVRSLVTGRETYFRSACKFRRAV